ncbi:hypothetical protein [Streptacidiphilus sp. MAP5-3]
MSDNLTAVIIIAILTVAGLAAWLVPEALDVIDTWIRHRNRE